MDLVLLRLTPGPDARNDSVSPEIATDILWATATAADRLEHIRARSASGGVIDVALFHHQAGAVGDAGGDGSDGSDGSPGAEPSAADLALRLARTATRNASTLVGWIAEIVTPHQPLHVLVG